MSNTVFVGNLSYAVEGQDLQSAFANFGVITEAKVIKDFHSGRSRGYGFVTFSTEDEALKAVEEMNDKEINGRSVRVNLARNKAASNGGFSQNRGGFNRRSYDSHYASRDR